MTERQKTGLIVKSECKTSYFFLRLLNLLCGGVTVGVARAGEGEASTCVGIGVSDKYQGYEF